MSLNMTLWATGTVLLAAGLHFAVKAVRDQQRRAQSAEQQLAHVGALIGQVSPSDWQHSVQTLLAGVVRFHMGRACALVAVTESGALELRATALAEGEAPWDSGATEEHARQVLEAKNPRLTDGVAYIPLTDNGEALGLLAVRGGSPDHLGIQAVAQLCTFGLSGIRLFRKQAALSNTDGLTGLANHRHFQQMLATALGQAYLEGEDLAVILLDIDRFKGVNDTYGHLFGDLVLREISYVLRRTLPPGAFPARYGGEELVVLLRGADALNAAGVGEEIRGAVEAHEVMDFTSGIRLQVTVSLGVAMYELGQGKSRLIARADEALYASKNAGRNRVTVAEREEVTSSLFPT